MVKVSYNKNHPELREGEFFLMNIFPSTDDDLLGEFRTLGWEKKRLGSVAYTPDGKRIKFALPVFIQEAEQGH